MRLSVFAGTFGVLAAALLISSGRVSAQTAPASPAQSVPSASEVRISADSAPYHIEWSGTTGTFTRKAFGGEPEKRIPLTYLHTDAGPTGVASHLAWFLARDGQSFDILWCYLNDSGTRFSCWLYRYPANQLTALQFTGDYRFTPLSEPPAVSEAGNLTSGSVPEYVGPSFKFRDWTTRIGALAQLDLRRPGTESASGQPTSAAGTPTKSISQLQIHPLHEVEVGAANGWRPGGWKELHALGFDGGNDPYYLILYSNTHTGFALDLKRGQLYTADFVTPVQFVEGGREFGPRDNPLNITPEIQVRRYSRHEITLTTAQTLGNPYVEGQAAITFYSPNNKTINVPAFWDGAGTWRVRIAPTVTGIWKWRSFSKIADLNGQAGTFECITESSDSKGFVVVQPDFQDTHYFAYSNGAPFLPSILLEPALGYTTYSLAPAKSTTRLIGQTDSSSSFLEFQKRVNDCARHGFNRFVGGYLLGGAGAPAQANEGGAVFTDTALEHLNPAFFQSMDRRIAYCNARGITPDIGLADLGGDFLSTARPDALFRLWSYVVSRYAAFDVHWNLFVQPDAPLTDTTLKSLTEFADLTTLLDPAHHPITLLAPGLGYPPPPVPIDPSAGFDDPFNDDPFGGAAAAPVVPAGPPPRQPGKEIASWENVVMLLGGNPDVLPAYWRLKKPIIVMERPAPSDAATATADATRKLLWETRMRGAYWVGNASPATLGSEAFESDALRWAEYCHDFFLQTRFNRLEPHQEMLGGPQESEADRKRRKRAEQRAALAIAAKAALDDPDAAAAPPDAGSAAPGDGATGPNGGAGAPGPGGASTGRGRRGQRPNGTGAPGSAPGTAPQMPQSPIFVLAAPAHEYVIYFEQGGSVLIDLLEATGSIDLSWLNPRTGETGVVQKVTGGAYTRFTAPDKNDWVLYLSRK